MEGVPLARRKSDTKKKKGDKRGEETAIEKTKRRRVKLRGEQVWPENVEARKIGDEHEKNEAALAHV